MKMNETLKWCSLFGIGAGIGGFFAKSNHQNILKGKVFGGFSAPMVWKCIETITQSLPEEDKNLYDPGHWSIGGAALIGGILSGITHTSNLGYLVFMGASMGYLGAIIANKLDKTHISEEGQELLVRKAVSIIALAFIVGVNMYMLTDVEHSQNKSLSVPTSEPSNTNYSTMR